MRVLHLTPEIRNLTQKMKDEIYSKLVTRIKVAADRTWKQMEMAITKGDNSKSAVDLMTTGRNIVINPKRDLKKKK